MNVAKALQYSQRQLEELGSLTARLDTLVLLEHTLNIDRSLLLANPDTELSESQQNVFGDFIKRRAKHEPLAYLLGNSEFYGRDFIITTAVLVPRPESETMIDLLKSFAPEVYHIAAVQGADSTGSTMDHVLSVADIGTGSGALGITAALELKNVAVELIDIDDSALKIAQMNVIKHTTSISLKKYDLLPADPHYDVLLCNVPYVPDNFNINKAAQFEPKIALFAGLDGLDLYRKLFQKLQIVRTKPLLILTEAFPEQHAALRQMADACGYTEQSNEDFIQAFKIRVEPEA